MRISPVLAFLALVGGVSAQVTVRPAAPAKAPVATTPKADAKAVDARSAAAKKKEEPERKVEGLSITRPDGSYLGLQVLGGKWVLTFYDKEKNKVSADVVRATIRWPVRYQLTDERTVLNPTGDGKSFTGPVFVRPPLTYKVFISLFREGSSNAVESYSADYRGE